MLLVSSSLLLRRDFVDAMSVASPSSETLGRDRTPPPPPRPTGKPRASLVPLLLTGVLLPVRRVVSTTGVTVARLVVPRLSLQLPTTPILYVSPVGDSPVSSAPLTVGVTSVVRGPLSSSSLPMPFRLSLVNLRLRARAPVLLASVHLQALFLL